MLPFINFVTKMWVVIFSWWPTPATPTRSSRPVTQSTTPRWTPTPCSATLVELSGIRRSIFTELCRCLPCHLLVWRAAASSTYLILWRYFLHFWIGVLWHVFIYVAGLQQRSKCRCAIVCSAASGSIGGGQSKFHGDLVILSSTLSPAGSPSRGGDVMVYVKDIHQPGLPTYSVLVSISVFAALSTVFHSINSPDNSLLSRSVLPVLFLPYWSFQL